jgi:small subunit ribosomal protein S21
MVKIQVRKDESLESALRRFKEMCKKEGIAESIMRKAYYQKAGGKQKRRRGYVDSGK